ncbi:NAD(P)/FAD-dependent oxidoreductase [Actinotalea sp. BY-33]|uniref:NAD(P)/FAD-dependent oxidoreductase n=1 Tax=Actinotalea soli TaxID=2819234 RepID=A0A939LR45_9CELL|nr:ArsO family NAD(P)H-dependent flavin-containing monooxygenase [Actinotalea soli]MBO1752956.1 NAD(P)/FAD-dependent oxidoreductase [Actinotalea soli]
MPTSPETTAQPGPSGRGPRHAPVVVIGGGQAGLAVGYHLRRAGLAPEEEVVVLDDAPSPGGAWPHMWDSLRLFSPAEHSSLPGWRMPATRDGFPRAEHVVDYLTRYEERYGLGVRRPVRVTAVHRGAPDAPRYRLETTEGPWTAEAVVSTTGTWRRPFWPRYSGQETFRGHQLHAADYREPSALAGRHVVVVGGGNSAAQLLAEVSTVASTTWVTPRPPRFLPDEVDGRALFEIATRRAVALARGETDDGGVGGLGDVVVVPSVMEARSRGVLQARPLPGEITREGLRWPDGHEEQADVVLWCTGFRPDLGHLAPLRLTRHDGVPRTTGTEVVGEPGLHLLGYGDWTGPASATLVGVGRPAKDAARAVVEHLRGGQPKRPEM